MVNTDTPLLQRRAPSWILPTFLLSVGMAGLFSLRGGGASADLTPPAKRRPAPAFSVTDLTGKPFKLSAKRGSVVLVNYFATWCPPCREELPDLVALARDKEAQGLVTLGISQDEGGPSVVVPFVREHSINYPVALETAPDMPPTPGFDVPALPTTVLVDKQGRVASVITGRVDIRAVRASVDKLLAE